MLSGQFDALAGKVADEGGFSIDAQGNAPSKGYMVAKHGQEHILEGKPAGSDLEKFASDNKPGAGDFMGAWHDDDGKTYLDVSSNVPDRASANRMGQEHAQRAIYSVKTGGAPKVKHAESIGRRNTVFANTTPQEHRDLSNANQEYARRTTEDRLAVEQWNSKNTPKASPSRYTQPTL